MIEGLRSDVEFPKQVCPEETDYIDIDRITGHSFRRSGAKALAKIGVPLDLIQYMARHCHSSQAILGYVEEWWCN